MLLSCCLSGKSSPYQTETERLKQKSLNRGLSAWRRGKTWKFRQKIVEISRLDPGFVLQKAKSNNNTCCQGEEDFIIKETGSIRVVWNIALHDWIHLVHLLKSGQNNSCLHCLSTVDRFVWRICCKPYDISTSPLLLLNEGTEA